MRKWILLPILLLLVLGLGMKKTTEEELNQWRYLYPSTTVSWNLSGDPAYCQQFVGEAKNMLYQLKNRMNIAVPKLKSLQDKRSPVPGTTIIVKSIFGQDVVEINALRGGFPSCLIKLLDLPEVVPPMKWYAPGQETFTKSEGGWVITAPGGETEVEGVDYIKTYYSLSVTACNECQPLALSLCTPDEIASLGTPWAGPKTCRPYTYDATKLLYLDEPVPFFQGFPDEVPPVPPDPENHLIYSFYESGQAEIIKLGSDAQGSYFLWKAYTEWGTYPPTDITFSRTGLGYLLLKAFITFEGRDLCQTQSIIKVDCCVKEIDRRKVEIWWEDSGTCQPFIQYAGVVYNGICKMPTEVPMGGTAGLAWYGCTHPQQPLYAIPEIKGSCLPVEWTLTGPIELWNSKKNDNIIFFKCIAGGCNEEARITLRDRCGTEYIVRGTPCCEDAAALSISYTSLLMSCNQQQTFTAIGGCAPYSWAVTTGGGSITQGGIYTAPATNVNCANNPTIQVTDCCGSTAEIKLAIDCYNQAGLALQRSTFTYAACPANNAVVCYGNCYPDQVCLQTRKYQNSKYNCDGTLYSYCDSGGDTWDCWASCTSGGPAGCWSLTCGGHSPIADCNTLYDERSVAMKEAGCCPINPFTGLPYD